MQNYCKTIGALAAASALVAGNVQAEVEYELHTGYSSEYLFRGVELGGNLVEVGFDAAYETNGLTVSGGFWATAFDADTEGSFRNNNNISTGNQVDNEIDFYGEVSKDFGFLTAAVGYIYYYNVGNANSAKGLGVNDQEVYFSVSRDLGFAQASLTYFWDIISNDGGNEGYSELALSRSFELNQCIDLNVATNVGYLVEGGDFTAWTTKVSIDWEFAENAKLSPFVTGSIALGESNGTLWSPTNNELLGGSMISVSF